MKNQKKYDEWGECNFFCFSTKLTLHRVNSNIDTVYYINIINDHNGYYPPTIIL